MNSKKQTTIKIGLFPVEFKTLSENPTKGHFSEIFLGSGPCLETGEQMLKDLAPQWLPGNGSYRGNNHSSW